MKSSAISKIPRFQFGTRVLLLAIIGFSVMLAYYTSRAKAQQSAVNSIRQLGGSVIYDYELGPDGFFRSSNQMGWRGMIATHVGPDYAGNVVGVRLDGTLVSDAEIEVLGTLSSVRSVGLASVQNISSDGVKSLRELYELQELYLSGPQLGDESLVSISRLPIRTLYLGGSRYTDAGVGRLLQMSELRSLQLRDTQVSPDGIRRLEAKGITVHRR